MKTQHTAGPTNNGQSAWHLSLRWYEYLGYGQTPPKSSYCFTIQVFVKKVFIKETKHLKRTLKNYTAAISTTLPRN